MEVFEKTFRVKGLQFHIPNHNDRIYIKDDVIKAFEDAKPIPVTIGMPDGMIVPLDKVCGFVEDIVISDDGVTVTLRSLDKSASGKIVKELLKNSVDLEMVSVGMGMLKNGIVSDFNLLCLSLVPKQKEFHYFMNGNQYNYRVYDGRVEALDGRMVVDGSTDIRSDDHFLIEHAGAMLQMLHSIDCYPEGAPLTEKARKAIQLILQRAFEAGIDTIGLSESGIVPDSLKLPGEK